MNPAQRNRLSPRFLRFRMRLLLGLALMLLLLAMIAIITVRAALDNITARNEVESTYEFLIRTNALLTAMVDAETGERGFLLTGNDAFLEPYYDASANARRLLRELQDSAAGSEERETRVRQLTEGVGIALGFLARVLDTYREEGPEAARQLVATGEGKGHMDRVRRVVRTTTAEKQARLEERRAVENRAEQRTLLTITLSLAIGASLLGYLTWLVHRETGRRETAEQALLQANAELQASLREVRALERERRLEHRLIEMLRGCHDQHEACLVIGRALPDLLPHRAGALGLLNPSRNLVEIVYHWGDQPITEEAFEPDICWALRRGRIHAGSARGATPLCRHMHSNLDNGLCLPLMAHSETLGVLILTDTEAGAHAAHELLRSVGEQISLSLANLRLQETLKFQSLRDPLTGLFNRRYLETALERELARAERRKGSVSVLMCDLDHFKRLNDTYGHDAGDLVLKQFADLLHKTIRGEDIACRYGGEEFLVILPDTPPEVGLRRATELCDAVRALAPVVEDGTPLRVSASFGVASFPQHGRSLPDLIARADAALYQAKRKGRDRVEAAASPPAGTATTSV